MSLVSFGQTALNCFRITLHITFDLRKHTAHLCVINHFTSEITEFAKLSQRVFSNGKNPADFQVERVIKAGQNGGSSVIAQQ